MEEASQDLAAVCRPNFLPQADHGRFAAGLGIVL
jgi:hypothetical protein